MKKKKIVVVSPLFPPEPVTSSRTSFQISEVLSKRDHEVTVVASFPSRPGGKAFPGWKRALYRQEERDGFRLVRCFSFYSGDSTIVSRALENLSFGITSFVAIMKMPSPDAIYANTWPILSTSLLVIAARLRKIPLVISIQDVYPESLVIQNHIKKNGLIERLIRSVDRWCASSADNIIMISDVISRGYSRSRKLDHPPVVIPNWVSSGMIDFTISTSDFRRRLRIPERAFILVYGGNVGKAAAVDNLIQVVLGMEDKRVILVVAGDGPLLARCRALADQGDCDRVRFWSPWHEDETSLVLRAADVLMLPTLASQTASSLPSKLLGYMLAGRPIIAQALRDSDTAAAIRDSQGGWVVDPDDDIGLLVAIEEAKQTPKERLDELGRNARQYALDHFVDSVCLPKVVGLIESLTERG